MGYLRKIVVIPQRSRCKFQCGVAMVEFLISVPFLLLMFAAVVEFGVMFYQQTTLNTAVQDGARYLAGGKLKFGSAGFTEIRAQQRTEATNLVVYGNILGSGSPLIDGFDVSMVTIECAYGTTASSTGSLCAADSVITLLSPISVSAQVQYSPVLGGMLTSFTGVNVSIPLKASTINVGF